MKLEGSEIKHVIIMQDVISALACVSSPFLRLSTVKAMPFLSVKYHISHRTKYQSSLLSASLHGDSSSRKGFKLNSIILTSLSLQASVDLRSIQ